MPGVRSTLGNRRRKGTGSIVHRKGGWIARAPHLPDGTCPTIASGLPFRKDAERALDRWLSEHSDGATTALYTGRGDTDQ